MEEKFKHKTDYFSDLKMPKTKGLMETNMYVEFEVFVQPWACKRS